ncbi:hypothetical protein [Pseudoalteromonas xiamenensis]|uniref:SHOCT domain-containing protein n=1 Tax=Pseudoalteromonas xiamenensis TaxID=882626 RepID=A0A975HM54_9GAMM|nr:hypothetical protein [Pseudoalteromonas xiamenensis]QTH70705.1 hypothetical protein J5O05_12320 [Pseudoalteromonas xiamenensis]
MMFFKGMLERTPATMEKTPTLTQPKGDKEMPLADFGSQLGQAIAATEMKSAQSDFSQQMQMKEVSPYTSAQTFLEKAREAVMFGRLGVNKEKINEIREKMDELLDLYAQGAVTQEEFQEKMSQLQESLAEEYRIAQERREESERDPSKPDDNPIV